MSGLRVLVVGASIAGPMTAYWLARAGAKVTVIERFPQLRSGGQNIDIRLTGVAVMRKIPGMEDSVRASLAPIDGMSLLRQDGSPVAVMKATGDAEQQGLVSEYEIFRGDLSRIIYDLSREIGGVDYIFNEQIESVEHRDDGPVRVGFVNGTPAADYDLIVACDGATSRTRALAFDCGVRAHVKPLRGWAAYFSTTRDVVGSSRICKGLNLPGGTGVYAGSDLKGRNRLVIMNVYPKADDPGLDKFRQAQAQGTDCLKQLVAERLPGSWWKREEILGGLSETDDLYASDMCQVKVPTLHRGRIVLVGDAGYAPGATGTGTTLAMTGAYILAGEISKHRDDLEAGVRAYEQQMEPLLKDMSAMPPGVLSFMGPQTAWGISVRNGFFAFVCWAMKFRGLFSWIGWFLAAGFGKDQRGLPTYTWLKDASPVRRKQ